MPTACIDGVKPRPPVTISDGRDPQFDAVCRTAAALFGVRYAFVSQPGSEYQWYIGSCGSSVGRVPRAATFCTTRRDDGSHAPLVVLDARRDPRSAEFPFVREAPYIRFYAGVPIVLRTSRELATICIADVEPRKRFGANDERHLLDLALFVEAILNARVAAPRLRRRA